MCGIAGVICSHARGDLQEILEAMVASLNHRGPDDWGTRILLSPVSQAGFGHARLSIIDLSDAGHQPMGNEDSTVWITYNGEIYNHLELREVLEKKGHVFKSHSDTEAIIHGYEEFGEEIFSCLNGMFALALWDVKKQCLFLARDRYGKKPLYYQSIDGSFIFASELKALLKHPDSQRKIDARSLSRYLLYEYVPAPHSIVEGILKLPAGHYLRMKEGSFQLKPYWSISFPRNTVPSDPIVVQELLLEKLKTSIQRRLMSDVPLGVFLSGGIDSSAIVALMSELVSADRIKTFSIGFNEASFDESGYARSVARRFGTDHHEQILTPSTMVDILPEIWSFMDEPFADASIIPTYLLSKFTRSHVTVALGGDGGDELFAGYDPFLAHRLACLYDWMPEAIHRRVVNPLAAMLPVSTANMSMDFRIKQFLKGIPYTVPVRNQIWLGSFSREDQQEVFNQDFYATCCDSELYSEIIAAENGVTFRDRTDEIIYLYSRFYLADDILTKVDRASMACSLEVRAPFLDRDFTEFVNSLPSNLKLKGLTRKYILKKSLESKLPRSILYRSKKGFGIPLSKWIREDLRPLVLDVFSHTRIRRAGIFNADTVQRIIDDHLSGKKDNRKQIWTLLMFEMWRERYAPGI